MKDIFSTVGTVLSFRIVYDRETGNPKGYGFAEYSDIEMAQSAIRNLNGQEFNGRTLRVDKASSQADELKAIHQLGGGAPVENPYGENVSPEKAPEAISRAVASLPPEQMYELMKQMKLCIQNNMSEARTMLLSNPQLAYALLQAQVIMKIVDPQVAMAMLHRKPDPIPAPIMPSTTSPIQMQTNVSWITLNLKKSNQLINLLMNTNMTDNEANNDGTTATVDTASDSTDDCSRNAACARCTSQSAATGHDQTTRYYFHFSNK